MTSNGHEHDSSLPFDEDYDPYASNNGEVTTAGDGQPQRASTDSNGTSADEAEVSLAEVHQEELDKNAELKEENRKLREQNEQLQREKTILGDRLKRQGVDLDEVLERAPQDPAETSSGPLVDDSPLDGCEPIDSVAYGLLPTLLREPCQFWERPHKRDVFLTAALGVVSGCLPNLYGYWGADVPTKHRPNLYMAFVAGSAGGKSSGDRATKLAEPVHDEIRRRWDSDLSDWKERKQNHDEEEDEPFEEERPKERGLWTPANTSYSHLLHTLDAQDGRGVIHSSEIDTVADALGQDWGAFDSLLRKAYHHEADDQGRRKSGTLRIEDPQISLVLGGTEQQFTSLVPSAENGLYSRLCLYYFDAADSYRSQRPSHTGIERTEDLEQLGDEIKELWDELDGRDDALRFKMKDAHWAKLDDEVDPLHRDVQALGYSHLISIPRRSALWAWRITMVLTTLQAWENDVPLGTAPELEATDEAAEAARKIAMTYADHSLRFARARLEGGDTRSPRDRRIATILDEVEQHFTNEDAYELGLHFDVTDRTIRRDLEAAESRGLVVRKKKSEWRQT